MSGCLCGKWKQLDDGCVARCDEPHGHDGQHVDSVIDIGWSADCSEITKFPEIVMAAKHKLNPLVGEGALLAQLSRVECAFKRLAAAQKEVTDAYDTIFYLVPEAHGEDGKELSVSDKITILGKQFQTAQEEVKRLQALNNSQAESIGGYISLVQAAKNAGVSFSWDGPTAVAELDPK